MWLKKVHFKKEKKKKLPFFSSRKLGTHPGLPSGKRRGTPRTSIQLIKGPAKKKQTAICADIHTQGQFKLGALPIHRLWTVGGSHSTQREPTSKGMQTPHKTSRWPPGDSDLLL